MAKISGPIMDRMDLCCEMSGINIEELQAKTPEEDSETIRARVMGAVHMQAKRYQGSGYRFNSEVLSQDVAKYCVAEPKAEEILAKIYKKMQLSVRAYYRLLKVSRTIADLEQSEQILEKHIKEAAQYRISG